MYSNYLSVFNLVLELGFGLKASAVALRFVFVCLKFDSSLMVVACLLSA